MDSNKAALDNIILTTATPDQRSRMLVTTWKDGDCRKFPFVWLRDNCQCDSCFDQTSQDRITLMSDLDTHSAPCDVTSTDKAVVLTWTDGHVSAYPLEWLDARSFTLPARDRRRTWYTAPCKLWGRELQGDIPTVSFNDLIQDDDSLYEWIRTLEEVGINIIKNAPHEVGQVHRIGQRIAYLRTTNYGETFQVLAKENASSVAYTAGTLGLHNDMTYFQYQAGVQMLHCLKQVPTEGGGNILSDGFNAAVQLKEQFPEYFRLLTEYPFDFQDIGCDHIGDHDLLTRQCIIQRDLFGNLCRINHSHHSRDSFMNDVPLEAVEPLYLAMAKFDQLLNHDDNVIKYKMDAGDILCIHNSRVLHGRSAYTVTGVRHLEGGYLDWDELASKKGVLMKRLSKSKGI